MQTMTSNLVARMNARLESYRKQLEMLETLLEEEMRQQHDQRRMHYLRFLHQERCVFGFAASELEELLYSVEGDRE